MHKKRFLLVFAALVLFAILFCVSWFWLADGPQPVSISVLSLTNDVSGARMALVKVTGGGRPSVILTNMVEYKVGDGWAPATYVPPTTAMELDGLTGRISTEFYTDWVHYPSNAAWRLRCEVVETQRGAKGLYERLKYPTGYRRRGGWFNVITGSKPSRYTGKTYYIETGEITP